MVQIYLNGSVALSIGGSEMGQGLNQKCIQIASRALGVNIIFYKIMLAEENVRILESLDFR